MPPCISKLVLLRCQASARPLIQLNHNPFKQQSRFNSTFPQLIVTPKTGPIDSQVKTHPQICFLSVYFEFQVKFLGEGFPSSALVELRADLRREEDKVHFSSTNRFFMMTTSDKNAVIIILQILDQRGRENRHKSAGTCQWHLCWDTQVRLPPKLGLKTNISTDCQQNWFSKKKH